MQDKSQNVPQKEGSKQEPQISKNELPEAELNKVTGGVSVKTPNIKASYQAS